MKFEKSIVLNNENDIKVNSAKTSMIIEDFGTFKAENVTKIYFTAGNESVKNKMVITMPDGDSDYVYRFNLNITQEHHHTSYLQNAYAKELQENATEVAGGTGAEMATAITKAYTENCNIRPNNEFVISNSGADLTIECKTEFLSIDSVSFVKLKNTDLSLNGANNYTNVALSSIVETKNVLGFGDTIYMEETIQNPTFPNRRYYAEKKTNKVKDDVLYSEFVIATEQVSDSTGFATLGQKLTSVVNYKVWAAPAVVTKMKALLGTIAPDGKYTVISNLTGTPTSVVTTAALTDTITADDILS